MQFSAYIDESGTHSSSPVVAVGGGITFVDKWEGLSREWQDKLDQWGLSHFHMAEWESLLGDYRTWDKPLAERRLRELLDIVYRWDVSTFGWAMARSEFERITAEFPETRSRCGGIYGYLGQQCLRQIRDNWGDFFTSHASLGELASVSYYFEEGSPGYGKIEKAWFRERETLRWHDELISRIPKRTIAPIQVADIVAYELREMFPMAAGWISKTGYRYPARQLARRGHVWSYASGTIFREQMLKLVSE